MSMENRAGLGRLACPSQNRCPPSASLPQEYCVIQLVFSADWNISQEQEVHLHCSLMPLPPPPPPVVAVEVAVAAPVVAHFVLWLFVVGALRVRELSGEHEEDLFEFAGEREEVWHCFSNDCCCCCKLPPCLVVTGAWEAVVWLPQAVAVE